jgi:prolyl-tRNA editing enzyme YbaK/EbsC (Cys-tRNA(Pro) deacylase)
MVGTLDWAPATAHLDLVAAPVAAALGKLGEAAGTVHVAAIDPGLADTAAFCEAYGVGLDVSANCVVVAAKRGQTRRLAACMVLATTKADVNGLVRRHLEAKKASFAPMDVATAESGMEYGGITPLGLPEDWPILVDAEVAATDLVVVGSGIRGSKLLLPGPLVAGLPGADVLEGLGT